MITPGVFHQAIIHDHDLQSIHAILRRSTACALRRTGQEPDRVNRTSIRVLRRGRRQVELGPSSDQVTGARLTRGCRKSDAPAAQSGASVHGSDASAHGSGASAAILAQGRLACGGFRFQTGGSTPLAGCYRAMALSPPSLSLGVEEEYPPVDPTSRDLVVAPPADFMAHCQERLAGRATHSRARPRSRSTPGSVPGSPRCAAN